MDDTDFTALLDPSLIRSARQIYTTYYEVHPGLIQRPIGVAINRFTHRGKLIFRVNLFCYRKNALFPLVRLSLSFIRV